MLTSLYFSYSLSRSLFCVLFVYISFSFLHHSFSLSFPSWCHSSHSKFNNLIDSWRSLRKKIFQISLLQIINISVCLFSFLHLAFCSCGWLFLSFRLCLWFCSVIFLSFFILWSNRYGKVISIDLAWMIKYRYSLSLFFSFLL